MANCVDAARRSGGQAGHAPARACKAQYAALSRPGGSSGGNRGRAGCATKDHKRVLLVFGGNWCYDCHVLDATFHSKEIAPLVNANYHVVHVNVGDYDKNLDLAKKYEIPLEKGVPSLAILDPDGKLVVSQKKGEFESTVRIGPEDVVAIPEKVEAATRQLTEFESTAFASSDSRVPECLAIQILVSSPLKSLILLHFIGHF